MYILVHIICVCFRIEQYDPSHYEKTHPHSISQVPKTQLANMIFDPTFVELTADVLKIHLYNVTFTWQGGDFLSSSTQTPTIRAGRALDLDSSRPALTDGLVGKPRATNKYHGSCTRTRR